MCRLVVYKGPPIALEVLITLPENSLVHQARDAQFHPGCTAKRNIRVNSDGFGAAWYRPDKTIGCIIKFPTPAWSCTNLLELARFVEAGLIMAHVRAASNGVELTGRVSYENTHPFKLGRYTFCHNGCVANFAKMRRKLLFGLSDEAFNAIEGSTDSEACFAVFIDEVGGCPNREVTAREMAEALQRTIARIVETVGGPCSLNFVVSDGRHVVASRYRNHEQQQPPSLYVITGEHFECDGNGSCLRPVNPQARSSVVISSEPLCRTTKGWHLVPKNSMVVVSSSAEDPFLCESVDIVPLHCHPSDAPALAIEAISDAEANPYLNSPKLGGREAAVEEMRHPAIVKVTHKARPMSPLSVAADITALAAGDECFGPEEEAIELHAGSCSAKPRRGA